MKVLQFVADGAPGGGTNHVLQLLEGIQAPFNSCLLTQEDTYLSDQASKIGVPVFNGNFFNHRLDRKAIHRVKKVIQRYSPDLIHCHGGRAGFFRSMIPKNIPTLYTVHGFHFPRKRFLSRLAGWAGEFWTIRRSSGIVFVSQFDHQLAMQKQLLPDSKPSHVIHNGIPHPQARERSKDLGVGFIGRFVNQKNPGLFLDVIEKLPHHVNATMVGGGELDEEVRQQIQNRGLKNRIELLGSLDHQSALDALSRMSCLLMTPRWEGLPLLPLEAMLLKVPVVSTSVGGIPEVIEHMQTGMLAEKESADELALHVDRLLKDENLETRLVNQAYQNATANFSETTMIDRVKQCYRKLLS